MIFPWINGIISCQVIYKRLSRTKTHKVGTCTIRTHAGIHSQHQKSYLLACSAHRCDTASSVFEEPNTCLENPQYSSGVLIQQARRIPCNKKYLSSNKWWHQSVCLTVHMQKKIIHIILATGKKAWKVRLFCNLIFLNWKRGFYTVRTLYSTFTYPKVP